jgi:hypothetical protein
VGAHADTTSCHDNVAVKRLESLIKLWIVVWNRA